MKLDIESVKKFKEYRGRGLSYREIEKLMGKELKTLTRYNQYIKLGYLRRQKLSTG